MWPSRDLTPLYSDNEIELDADPLDADDDDDSAGVNYDTDSDDESIIPDNEIGNVVLICPVRIFEFYFRSSRTFIYLK